jgi:hypothetical protein
MRHKAFAVEAAIEAGHWGSWAGARVLKQWGTPGRRAAPPAAPILAKMTIMLAKGNIGGS